MQKYKTRSAAPSVEQVIAQVGRPPKGYREFLEELKSRVRSAQIKATISVNRELLLLYWDIGRRILECRNREGWGGKVIDRLAADLRRAFPGTRGFSVRNLNYMRAFAEAYPDHVFVQQVVAQIPWGHHARILDYVKDPPQREWYIRQSVEHGWSRNVLVHQIESCLYERQGKAITNFKRTLLAPGSDLAQELTKDPYAFDFLTLANDAREKDLQRALLDHLRDFLLELGRGFSFVGSQHPLSVGSQEFFLDLLFYHLRLHSFIVIELKTGEFKPEYAGKMNFYLSAVDDQLRHKNDNPSIGIILCKSRDRVIVEYALRDAHKPIGVSAYRLTRSLPDNLKETLPTLQELKVGLGKASGKRG